MPVSLPRFARLAATLAALAAFACAGAAASASTTITGNVNPIVKWNTQITGTLNLAPNYDPTTGATKATGIGAVQAATNALFTGTPGCTPAPAQSGILIDFSNVQLPTAGNTTACDYKNALAIGVTTNDTTGWNVTEQLNLVPGTGITLCSLPNGTLFAGTPTAGSPMPATAVAAGSAAAINETSCAGGGQLTLGTGSGSPTAQTIVPTQVASGTFYRGQDVLLLLTSSTLPSGTYSTTLTVTLTLN